jgi:two-component system, NarL family, response regulator NreC
MTRGRASDFRGNHLIGVGTAERSAGGCVAVILARVSEETGKASATKIVLADDHAIVRDGIRMVLEAEGDMEVVAEAADGEAAVRSTLGHKPDVLVLDLNMPGFSGLEAIPRALEASPETAVVILTMQDEPAFAREALRAGARGYVIKQSATAELVGAVRAVVAGDTYINPGLGARMAAEPVDPGPPDGLTPRETEILNLLALGHTNPEIADQLVLSVRTVETHRANIQHKTNASTRAELVAYASEHGLLER